MHPRNPFNNPPNFSELSQAYPALKPYVTQSSSGWTIDFHNSHAQRRLTEALLHKFFGLSLSTPENRLCPPVPNRMNYILWLEDIIRATYLASRRPETIRGIDIGTGASAIYPLLGCRTNPTWTFVGTDIDDISLKSAQKNIESNSLKERIDLIKSDPSGSILPMTLHDDIIYDFTMCNPPFYSDKDEVRQSAEAKQIGPNAVCTGADVEMITPGGESAFVCKMVHESINFGAKCRWYTSMLGKMSSLNDVVKMLREHKIDNYAITEFVQGQTRRWAIAWSFDDIHLPDTIAQGCIARDTQEHTF
ncbi:hypothetical protein QCA50_004558 [Cerrena zonata]|uniref:U6 small nuclear RNA (adenine-(43)-N(6))-methyltransferase n=1 Tax=Cerrena zonata TaxID=2478898 RepID=A0AAW0GU22_9APHY